jgi:hypothetical protein
MVRPEGGTPGGCWKKMKTKELQIALLETTENKKDTSAVHDAGRG